MTQDPMKPTDSGGEEIAPLARSAPRPMRLDRRRPHDRGVDAESFEDSALDSMLEEFSQSDPNDGSKFLAGVKSKLESGSKSGLQPASDTSAEDTFFGIGSSLVSMAELANDQPQTKVDAALAESNNSKLSLVKVTLGVTAACLVIGFLGWAFWKSPSANLPSQVPVVQNESSNEHPDGKAPPVVRKESDMVNASQPESHEQLPIRNSNEAVDLVDPKAEVKNTDTAIASATDKTEKSSELKNIDSLPSAANQSAFVENKNAGRKTKPRLKLKGSVWELRVKFDESWLATAWVNGKKLDSKISVARVDSVLARIGHEVGRRVHFVSPMLPKSWIGSVVVEGNGIDAEVWFEGIDQMHDRLFRLRRAVDEQLQKANVPKIAVLPLGELRFQNSKDLELPVVCEAIEILGELLMNQMTASLPRRAKSRKYKNYRVMSSAEVAMFGLTGEVKLPSSVDPFVKIAIQEESPKKLALQLEDSIELNMFENAKEFHDTLDWVGSKSEKGRIGAKIRKTQLEMAAQNRRYKDATNPDVRRTILNRLKKEQAVLAANQELAVKARRNPQPAKPVEPLNEMLSKRPELKGLPLVMGDACHLEKEDAVALSAVSRIVGGALQRFDRFGSRNFKSRSKERLETIRRLIRTNTSGGNRSQALRTIDQMLQVERPELRMELVNALSQDCSETSCDLLACYAKYDVEPRIRTAATNGLRAFPTQMARKYLIEGFRYPWPEVAKNSAEALVRLNDSGAVPALVQLLGTSDPRTPQTREDGVTVQRELVAINHMRNCLLCHSDSQERSDMGRGLIPIWGLPLVQKYYHGAESPEFVSVRADTTYLRQDFSVIRRVKDAAPWPANQRFDYLVRLKTLTEGEAAKAKEKFEDKPNEYHAAIVKALGLLTGKKPENNSYESWSAAIGRPLNSVPQSP